MKVIYDDKDIVVFIKEANYDSEKITYRDVFNNDDGKLYCVHRLDKVVSGLTVYAKNSLIASKLTESITSNSFKKEYLCVCENIFDIKKDKMEDFIFHDRKTNKTFVVKSERKDVKKAILYYDVLDEVILDKNEFSLVKIALETGRTHQIRVQFSSRKHPLVGDQRYGSKIKSNCFGLWSYQLEFMHPTKNELMKFTEKPDDCFPWNLFNIMKKES